MDQLQPVTSTIHNVQMAPAGSSLSVPTSIQPMKPGEQMRLPSPMPHYVGGPQTASAGMDSSALYMMPRTSYTGFQQLGFPNSELRGMGTMFIDTKSQHIQMPVKRKSPMENMPGYPLSPRVLMPNKEIGQMEHRPWLNTLSPHKGNTQNYVYSTAGVLAAHQLSAQNKKTIQLQAGPPKSGFQKSSASRSHPSQGQPSPRVQNDEPVRSKLRESICAALALVIEKGKSSSQGGTSASAGANDIEQNLESSESAEIATNVTPAEFPGDNRMDTNDDYSTQIEDNVKSQPTAVNGNVCGSPRTYESVGQELNVTDFMPDEEEATAGKVSATDDLLQGNGLSWVLDFDAWVAEKEGHDPKRQKVGENGAGGREPKKTNSPQNLAFLIELELFKLFGGVNKKYKEKGRSLLFNLKDRNNPELREKVMSGDISPARLCSMSAEELASKELSEWRIAKAEEFDQMKILPDSDIDIRRLVKKTHKGEFQVEVEEDDVSVSVEVSVGSSTFPRIQTENKETETKEIGSLSGEKLDGDPKEMVNQKNDPDQNLQCTITIPSNESSDLMQGLIEDELKDAAFLPPIVSLDEFMESLHSEPPFENLPPDAGTAASLDNDNSEAPSETKPTKLSPDGRTSAASEAEDNMDKNFKAETDIKPTDNQPEIEISPPVVVSKGEQIWEGSLQLSISSTVAVTGLFKSGEKAATKEWPRTMEIKGRVRLDAFEKFLQDLYKSRSRHIMVMHVLLKEQEGKDTEALSQVVDSYVADDRVGFAEPLRGLEVYLCPYHPKILDRVGKHMTKDQTEALTLSADDKGLIGVIVWRKAHVSPHSSSHHRHSLKKQQQEHYTPRKHSRLDRNINVNSSNLTPKYPLVPLVSTKSTLSAPTKAATLEDDLPPGFGPQATQDDDDLPEFNFSGGLSGSVPTQNRPADQMRQLVQKYGQNAGSGQVVKSWKDDDDIPEWQPQAPLTSVHPQPSTPTQHNYQPLNQPMLQHLINQQLLRAPLQQPQAPLPLQPPLLATQQNSTPSWPQQQQQQQTGVWINPQGQFFGTQRRGF